MPGTTIPLFTKREFDFSDTTAAQSIVVVKAVDVSQYTEGALLVRVHSPDVASSSTIDVIAQVTLPSSEEPSTDFVNTTEIAKATLTSGSAAGDLERAVLTDDFGGFLQIKVTGTKSGGNCAATISADLVVKS